jgi:hypothetical protein
MRWYDKELNLGKNIDRLKHASNNRRDTMLRGILRIINQYNPSLLDDNVMNFPLDIEKRRWYDSDPDLWLIVNGLKYANQEIKDNVANYMEQEYQLFLQQKK